jgi:hypothetical protein
MGTRVAQEGYDPISNQSKPVTVTEEQFKEPILAQPHDERWSKDVHVRQGEPLKKWSYTFTDEANKLFNIIFDYIEPLESLRLRAYLDDGTPVVFQAIGFVLNSFENANKSGVPLYAENDSQGATATFPSRWIYGVDITAYNAGSEITGKVNFELCGERAIPVRPSAPFWDPLLEKKVRTIGVHDIVAPILDGHMLDNEGSGIVTSFDGFYFLDPLDKLLDGKISTYIQYASDPDVDTYRAILCVLEQPEILEDIKLCGYIATVFFNLGQALEVDGIDIKNCSIYIYYDDGTYEPYNFHNGECIKYSPQHKQVTNFFIGFAQAAAAPILRLTSLICPVRDPTKTTVEVLGKDAQQHAVSEAFPLDTKEMPALVADCIHEAFDGAYALTREEINLLFDKAYWTGTYLLEAGHTLILYLKTPFNVANIKVLDTSNYYVSDVTCETFDPGTGGGTYDTQPWKVFDEIIAFAIINGSENDANIAEIVAETRIPVDTEFGDVDVEVSLEAEDPLTSPPTLHQLSAVQSSVDVIDSTDRASYWDLMVASKMFGEIPDLAGSGDLQIPSILSCSAVSIAYEARQYYFALLTASKMMALADNGDLEILSKSDLGPFGGITRKALDVVNVPFIHGRDKSYEDTEFTAGETGRVLDLNTDLGRNGHDGYIKVDTSAAAATGDLLVEISNDGATYGTQKTLKNGDTLRLEKYDIDSIRLTHSGTNCGYRITVL